LQFPRSAFYPVFCEELAEPVGQKPRILEVPEEARAMSPLLDIGLAPLHDADESAGGLELPLGVASSERRALAGAVDGGIVLLAGCGFGAALWRWSLELPFSRLTLAVGMVILALFWLIYQYLF